MIINTVPAAAAAPAAREVYRGLLPPVCGACGRRAPCKNI